MLSAALMLRWLGERHADDALLSDAKRIESAVEDVLAQGHVVPADQGGKARCSEFTEAVLRQLR
jgi:3-isopropylmalate dehydrogenase